MKVNRLTNVLHYFLLSLVQVKSYAMNLPPDILKVSLCGWLIFRI